MQLASAAPSPAAFAALLVDPLKLHIAAGASGTVQMRLLNLISQLCAQGAAYVDTMNKAGLLTPVR